MYFDEDGDLAHEFYQEEKVTGPSGGVRWRMKQIFDRLIPQVDLRGKDSSFCSVNIL